MSFFYSLKQTVKVRFRKNPHVKSSQTDRERLLVSVFYCMHCMLLCLIFPTSWFFGFGSSLRNYGSSHDCLIPSYIPRSSSYSATVFLIDLLIPILSFSLFRQTFIRNFSNICKNRKDNNFSCTQRKASIINNS